MSIETSAKTPGKLQDIFKNIETLKLVIDPEHPRYPEYIAIMAKAKSAYERAGLASDMIDGQTIIDAALETLKDLYKSAMEIRASMLHSSIAKAIEVQPGKTIKSTLEEPIDTIKDTGLIPSDAKKLKDMAKGLAVNPADLLLGSNVPGNRYYGRANSEIFVRLGIVAKDEKLLAELRHDVLPEVLALEPLLRKLETGLLQLRAFNPVRTQMFNWAMNFKNNKNEMDKEPLRLLGVVAGGLLSGVGLATNLISGSPVTWPTFAWAGVAAYSLCPDFMGSNGRKERAFIAQFTKPEMKKLMGSFNVEAFEELQAAYKHPVTKKLINQFSRSDIPLSDAQIGALTDGKKTLLTEALRALNANGMAQAALQKFGQESYSKGEIKTLTMLMGRS